MKDHLNIFEYYNQNGAFPIENNSTRNLGIVIKNNPIVFYSFLDLLSEKSNTQIIKPTHPDEWFLELQVKIKNFAKEDLEISNVIAVTLTTNNLEFYKEEGEESETENITDMIIFSKGTLVIIEAKRDNVDARNQLKKQIKELEQELRNNDNMNYTSAQYVSLTWDEVVGRLNDINMFTDERDPILNDYVEHIKNSVPSFFPVQILNRLEAKDTDHIKRRIERFANNYGTDVIVRNKTGVPLYWVKLLDKEYVKELTYRNYDNELALYLYPGNTIKQGHNLFNKCNTLSILQMSSISIRGIDIPLSIQPYLKISDAWGKGKFEVSVNATDRYTLEKVFKDVCGRKKGSDNAALIKKFDEFKDIISINSFEEKFKETFKDSEHDYTFIVSLTICIYFEKLFEVLKRIDCLNIVTNETDAVVEFTKEIVNKIYYLIEN